MLQSPDIDHRRNLTRLSLQYGAVRGACNYLDQGNTITT